MKKETREVQWKEFEHPRLKMWVYYSVGTGWIETDLLQFRWHISWNRPEEVRTFRIETVAHIEEALREVMPQSRILHWKILPKLADAMGYPQHPSRRLKYRMLEALKIRKPDSDQELMLTELGVAAYAAEDVEILWKGWKIAGLKSLKPNIERFGNLNMQIHNFNRLLKKA